MNLGHSSAFVDSGALLFTCFVAVAVLRGTLAAGPGTVCVCVAELVYAYARTTLVGEPNMKLVREATLWAAATWTFWLAYQSAYSFSGTNSHVLRFFHATASAALGLQCCLRENEAFKNMGKRSIALALVSFLLFLLPVQPHRSALELFFGSVEFVVCFYGLFYVKTLMDKPVRLPTLLVSTAWILSSPPIPGLVYGMGFGVWLCQRLMHWQKRVEDDEVLANDPEIPVVPVPKKNMPADVVRLLSVATKKMDRVAAMPTAQIILQETTIIPTNINVSPCPTGD